jgi:hypothetical protein
MSSVLSSLSKHRPPPYLTKVESRKVKGGTRFFGLLPQGNLWGVGWYVSVEATYPRRWYDSEEKFQDMTGGSTTVEAKPYHRDLWVLFEIPDPESNEFGLVCP